MGEPDGNIFGSRSCRTDQAQQGVFVFIAVAGFRLSLHCSFQVFFICSGIFLQLDVLKL